MGSIGLAKALVDSASRSLTIDPRNTFMLAESLMRLATETPERRDALAEELVMNAVSVIQTSRELDAYEMLPHDLWTPGIREAARQRACEVLGDETDHLLRNVDDPDVIRVGAADIEQRAQSYRLDLNIGPLLDRANDLRARDAQASSWPETKAELEVGTSVDDSTSIQQIFSRFAQ